AFPSAEQANTRERLARMLRCVISQRLVPRREGVQRIAVFEILQSGSKLLDRLLTGSPASKPSEQLSLDADIEKLLRAGIVSTEIGLTHAIDPKNLAKKLGASEK